MTCLGVLERRERDNDNATGLKVGERIEMSTTVLSIYAMHRSLSLFVFTYLEYLLRSVFFLAFF